MTTDWQTELTLLIEHPEQSLVWVQEGDDSAGLPVVVMEEKLWLRPSLEAQQVVAERLGLGGRLSRYLSYTCHRDQRREHIVAKFEPDPPGAQPCPAGKWVDAGQVVSLTTLTARDKAIITGHFAETGMGTIPENRPAWFLPHWFEEASSWMRAALPASHLHDPVEILHRGSWGLSSLLVTQGQAPAYYLKACPDHPPLTDEPGLMQALAKRLPEHVPTPLAINRLRRWMLLEDFGEPLSVDRGIEVQGAVLSRFGGLQLALASDQAWLEGCGCRTLSLPLFAQRVAALLRGLDSVPGLETASREALRKQSRCIMDRIEALQAHSLPLTLVHGDLHLDNVYRDLGSGNIMYFDWANACVSHPFFDVSYFYLENTDCWQDLAAPYLENWRGYLSPEQLEDAMRLAIPLALINQAIFYEELMSRIETPYVAGFQHPVAYMLNQALDALTRLE